MVATLGSTCAEPKPSAIFELTRRLATPACTGVAISDHRTARKRRRRIGSLLSRRCCPGSGGAIAERRAWGGRGLQYAISVPATEPMRDKLLQAPRRQGTANRSRAYSR